MPDQATSNIVGSVILVGIVTLSSAGWILTQQPSQLATDATIPARPVANGSLENTYAYELEVTHIQGADQANATLVLGQTSIPWQIHKGATARVACPPPGVPIDVVLDDRVIAWTATPACHNQDPSSASRNTTMSSPPPATSGCQVPITAEALVTTDGTAHGSSATVGVTLCQETLP